MPLFPTILKDPALNLDKKQRLKLLGQANSKWFKQPRNVILYIGILIGLFLVMTFAGPSLIYFGLYERLANAINLLVIFPALVLTAYYTIFNFNFLPHLYKELRALGHNICPKCGYPHIELPDSEHNCPECGTTRTPLPNKPSAPL